MRLLSGIVANAAVYDSIVAPAEEDSAQSGGRDSWVAS